MTALISNADIIIRCTGDCPLIEVRTLDALFAYHETQQCAATVLTAKLKNPFGYGRILRNENNDVKIGRAHV